MIRSKAQVTGQHKTTVFAPVKHKYKTPEACPAEVVGPPALETVPLSQASHASQVDAQNEV